MKGTGVIMNAVVKAVLPESPASRTIIAPGDILRKIDGNAIGDILDYKYHSYDSRILIELVSAERKIKFVRLKKTHGEDIGLEFETFLLDNQRSCSNKCIFCFIDQLPAGMRETLYYKDDDVRLSFLQGNYITLTNLTWQDIDRMIKMRISPINVSVHTLDPDLRAFMLGTKKGGDGIKALKALAGAGITLNCQIVCCPGINDGMRLTETMEELIRLGGCVNSVSIVPVGLTSHRQGLMPLRPFNESHALETIRQVGILGKRCMERRGSRVFYCADELYITAGLELPPHEHYEDYPQLENGVGMMRLFITEFLYALNKKADKYSDQPRTGAKTAPLISIATGTAAAEYLTNLLKSARKKYDTINFNVFAVNNDFFGHTVTVSGLVTGRDIITQLKGKKLGSGLLIPQNMLRRDSDVFLDDVTVTQLSAALGVPVRVVGPGGAELLRAFLEENNA